MKGKGGRQSHKATNTFVFRGFGEKVRALRVSARKYLLQRPKNEEGEDTTFLYEAINKARDLDATEQFTAFLRELGSEIRTTSQLVHHEARVVKCFSTHISIPETTALQALFDLLVAFANDLPQEFYKQHFYNFLPKLVAHLSTKNPEQIESVFLCIVSLFVVLQKYLYEDLYELYHVQNFSALLSKSYPWYVNELAAQSLGVLVRKIPNKDKFIGMSLRKLKKDESQVQGLGRVFAAMMKSDVIQRLHSCTPKILSKLLEVLKGGEEVPQEPALEAVKFAVSLMVSYVTSPHPDKSILWQTLWEEDASLVWPTLWDCVKGLLLQSSPETPSHLNCVLQVAQILVSHKRGALITNVDDVLTNCLAVLELSQPDSIGYTMVEILATLLNMPRDRLSSSALQKIVSLYLSSTFSPAVKFSFMKQVIEFERFDNEILPLLLPFLDSLMADVTDPGLSKNIIEFIVDVTVHKRPPCSTGMDLSTWSAYRLDFSKQNIGKEVHIGSFIEKRVKEGVLEDLSNLEDLSLCLLCLPHVLPLNHQDLAPYLTWILNDAIALLKDEARKIVDTDKPLVPKKRKSEVVIPDISLDMNIKSNIPLNTRRVLFLIGLVIEVMSHILSNEEFLASLSQLELLELIKQKHHYRENIHILRAIDLHFTIASSENKKDIMNEDFLKELYSSLAPALASSNPQVRLLVLHIFSLFPVNLPPPPENATANESVFEILLKAECVPMTPWEFRDRLRYITMVDAEHVKPHSPVSGHYSQAPLLFLIGQLYTNYRDIWTPIVKAISGYAHAIPIDVFWPLWFSKLKIASHVTREVLARKQTDPEVDLQLSCSILAVIDDHLSLHPGYSKLPSKPDHLNFRDLLWKAMEKFPDVCEAKNRDVVPIFFDFLEKEFFPVDFTVSPTQDISAGSGQLDKEDDGPSVTSLTEGKSMEVDGDEVQGEQAVAEENLQEFDAEDETAASPKRASVKSLCEQLKLFSKFRNLKMLSQTKKLETMCLELLTHPSPGLQKAAFDCLLSYNYPYLTPYKDHMYKLLDDKSFKNALTLFSIDGSEKTLEDDHRKDFMPYLMRLLYGKMHFKTGSNTAGKNKTEVRKAVILRFLAGTNEDEFQTFIELAFDVILGHLEGTALDVVNRSGESLNLKKVVPLKRLQGALTTMQNIIERVANRMTKKRSLLLKVILYIGNISTLILEHRSEVKRSHISFLKHIRQRAQKQIVSFFSALEDYSWESEEIDAIFETMVWPNLKRLPDEGLSYPTPLLNLFECWTENPRFFPLLAKVHRDDTTLTPLTYVVKLVASEKCNRLVRTTVFNMVERLLTFEDHIETVADEEGKTLPLLVCPPTVEVKKLIARDGSAGQQNYGSALLVPHLEGLLQSMKIVITNLGKNIIVSQRDLTILTSLTEWVTSKGISEDLLSLIIPLIVKKCVKSDEVIAQLLTTCSYLLPIVEDGKQFLRPLTTQFGCLRERASREALCQAVSGLTSVYPEYKEISDLAADLNSWNPKVVDEPAFERRLNGYKRISEYCEKSESIDIEFCQFVVYNNMFVICQVEDTSLRDMSRLCLEQLIELCVRLQPVQPSEVKQIIIDRLLSQLRIALRNRKEEVRHDVVFLLQKIVRKCHSFNDRLQDLYKLVDETDDDSDFFCNMMHIQRHRRSRALMRVADKLKKGSLVLMTETLTDYLLPLVRVYLFNDIYAKDDHLVQSSVRCLGAFATLLPWYPYLRMLKLYMGLLKKLPLKYHKLVVRILEVLINGFHEEIEEVKVFEEKQGKHVKVKAVPLNRTKEDPNPSEVNETKDKKEVADAKGSEKLVGEECKREAEKDMMEVEFADLPLTAGEEKLTKPQKVYLSIVSDIIPSLKKTLVARTSSDKKHKVNKSKYPEDEDIKRIPLAFALIKLMKKLPPKVLDANVSSILMKMITFLRCQSQPIREEARAMLVKIMVELGGKYLPWLVSDLRIILTRGFQAHVLVFTLHSVLSRMRSVLSGVDIDACLIDVVEICKNDLVGMQAEEKKVGKITTKVKEARNEKSFSILNFTAEYISAQRLADLVMALKEVLASTQDKKIVNKIAQCLDSIGNGLERNENIELMQKSVFIYGILNEKLSLLKDNEKKCNKKSQKIQRPDSFLLEPEPKKARLTPKTTFRTTSHLFIEFALKLLASLMRQEKFNPKEPDHLKLLVPYVGVMEKCLSSEYPDIGLHALKCINLLVKYPLPDLETQLGDVCSEMFVILHKFSSSELAKGKLYELVQLTFRSLAFIIKTLERNILSVEQVRVLLQYVQESLDDGNYQTTVFAILQSIIAKKIDAPELHVLMESVKKMSITCTRQYALNQARVTYFSYLLTYPMKKKVILNNVKYYLGNISYCMEEGRLSAQMFINGVITNFPVNVITKDLEASLWLKISEQLLREQFKENRVLLHKSLRTLFERSERRLYLIDLCLKLLGDNPSENVETSAIAVQFSCKALSAFMDAPAKKIPKNVLALVAPKIIPLLNPARFSVQMKGVDVSGEDTADAVAGKKCREVDKSLVTLMEVLTKLAAANISSTEWCQHVGDELWINIQSFLFYPHIQVRLSAVALIGQLLAAYPVDGTEIPILCSTTEKARSLMLDLCEVLQTQAATDMVIMTQLSLSVVRNLIYLIRNACRVSLIRPKTADDDDVDAAAEKEGMENEDKEVDESKEERDPVVCSALWVLRRVGNLAYKELQESGKDYTLVREALLNLMAGMIVVLGDKLQAPVLLSYIIKHLARELSDKKIPEKLLERTQEVANLVKDHVGLEIYTRRFTEAQVGLSKKRLERKAHEHQQKLVNPQQFSKKKKKKIVARAAAKKIIIAERKGKVIRRGKFVKQQIVKSKLAKLRANAIISE